MRNPVSGKYLHKFLFSLLILISVFTIRNVYAADCIDVSPISDGGISGGGGCCGGQQGIDCTTFDPCCYSEEDGDWGGANLTQCNYDGFNYSCEIIVSCLNPYAYCGSQLSSDFSAIPCCSDGDELYSCQQEFTGEPWKCLPTTEEEPCAGYVELGNSCSNHNDCCQVDPDTGEDLGEVQCLDYLDGNGLVCSIREDNEELCYYQDSPGKPHYCDQLSGDYPTAKLCCDRTGEYDYFCDFSLPDPICVVNTSVTIGGCQDTSGGGCLVPDFNCCPELSGHTCQNVSMTAQADYRCIPTTCPDTLWGPHHACDPTMAECNGGCRDDLICSPFSYTCKFIRDDFSWNYNDFIDLLKKISTLIYLFGIAYAIGASILSGYKLMTSQGDPSRVKDAKETISSAVMGVIFLVLAATILRIVLRLSLGV